MNVAIAIVIMIYVAVAIYQIPKLVDKQLWKDLAAFCALCAMAFALGILFSADVKIPSPMEWVRILIEDILHIKYPEGS